MSNHAKPPVPYIAMQSNENIARLANELCSLDLDGQPNVRSIEENPLTLPDGSLATIRCTRTKTGVRISITIKAVAQ